jgi:hypothetical protein
MRLSSAGQCLPISGPCQANADCNDDSICLAGRCEPGHRFRRIEVFIDGAPVALGFWSVPGTGEPNIANGSFSLRGAVGLALRASWSINPRWSLGAYLGYLRAADGEIENIDTSYPEIAPVSTRFRLARLGSLVNYRWAGRHRLAYGLGLEAGFVVGSTGRGDTAFGVEVGPDFFLDVPLSSGWTRSYLTLSFGFRAGSMDDTYDLPSDEPTNERWFYFMPVIRGGFGVGR